MANTTIGGVAAPRRKGSGEPLDDANRAALTRLARLVPSEEKAAALLDISARTYARAMAGLGLRRGTRLLIEVRLRDLRIQEVGR